MRKYINTIEIISGYKCNINCVYCSTSAEFPEINMNTASIKKLISQAKEKYSAAKIALSGGEPTIRKDIVELVKYCKELEFKEIAVKTNGLLFYYERNVNKLIAAGMDKVHITFHGPHEELYSQLTLTKNSYDFVLQGIKNVLKHKKKVVIDLSVTRINQQTLSDSVILLRGMGIEDFYLWLILPEGESIKLGKEFFLSMTEAKPVYENLFENAKKNDFNMKSLFVPYCVLPDYAENIFNPIDEGIIITTPQRELLLEDSNLDLGDKIESCRRCRRYATCFGPHNGYVELWGTDEFRPLAV